MNLQRIEHLIGKYEKAETTLEEEKELKIFFMQKEVPSHLKKYKEMFSAYHSLANQNLDSNDFDERILAMISDDKEFNKKSGNRRNLYTLFAIAASIIILIGIYFRYGFNNSVEDETFNNPELAYAETKKILLKVSSALNKGLSGLDKVSEFDEGLSGLNHLAAFDEGMENMKKIAILDNTKEIITTK